MALTHPWVLDTVIITLTVRSGDGHEEERHIAVKAAGFAGKDFEPIDFSVIRVIPTWTNVADVDTLAGDPKTGEKRLIKAGTRISYEDKPLEADTEKPQELVDYERQAF